MLINGAPGRVEFRIETSPIFIQWINYIHLCCQIIMVVYSLNQFFIFDIMAKHRSLLLTGDHLINRDYLDQHWVWTWISDYMNTFLLVVIIYPYPDFTGASSLILLKVRHSVKLHPIVLYGCNYISMSSENFLAGCFWITWSQSRTYTHTGLSIICGELHNRFLREYWEFWWNMWAFIKLS